MMTMASSTTIPRTMVSPARDTVCKSMPAAHMIPRVERMEIGMADAATRATRVGSRMTVTRMTAMTAMANSFRKDAMALETASGTLEMVISRTSGGRDRAKRSITRPTSLPNWTTLLPGCISRETMRHFFPSTRT